MNANRLARLTEQQRVCLRLVFAHMTSKEIAPQLGIEPGSVDQHIKAAMRTLDVPDRRSAARMLAEFEGMAQPALVMREEQKGFEARPVRPAGLRLPLPFWGVRPADLTPLQRLAWIFALMMAIAFAFGVFLAGLEALSRIGRAINQ
jgi:DNA-binding CsgD family transcriptional regulator